MKYGPSSTITEEEAKEYLAILIRLRRVWDLDKDSLKVERIIGGYEWHFKVEGNEVTFTQNESYTSIFMFRGISREGPPILICRSDDRQMVIETGETYKGDERYAAQQQLDRAFATQRMPFFRRCCWLSGVPIEASADEKAEWIQGFSREEVEGWNLPREFWPPEWLDEEGEKGH